MGAHSERLLHFFGPLLYGFNYKSPTINQEFVLTTALSTSSPCTNLVAGEITFILL